MKLRIIVAAMLIACNSKPAPPRALIAPNGAAGGDCIDPRSMGAIPDDGLDDREAIQAAIDSAEVTHKTVCIGPGHYAIAKDPALGATHIPSLKISGDGITLSGAGESQTKLVMMGGKANDWTLLDVTGSHHHVTALYLDGTDRGQTDSEQTHLLQISGPATDIVLDHLRFTLPQQTGNHGGDCLRFLGNEPIDPTKPQELIDGVTVTDSWLDDCDRSGIGVQRGVSHVTFRDVYVRKAGDQALDMEPTGNGEIRWFTFTGGALLTGHAGIAVTLTGNNTDAYNLILDSVDIDGQIFMYRTQDVTLRGLHVTAAGAAPLAAIKEGAGIIVEGGYYERTDVTKPGPVISFSAHAGNYPTDVVIRDVRVVQRTDAPAIKSDPMVGLDVDGGTIDCLGPTANTKPAILGTDLGHRAEHMRVRGVTVRGNCKWGVQIMGGTNAAGSIVVTGNAFEVGTAGFRYDGVTPLLRPVIDGNLSGTAGAATTGLSSTSPATLLYQGQNVP